MASVLTRITTSLALIGIFIMKKIRAESPFNITSPWSSMALTNNTDFTSPLIRDFQSRRRCRDRKETTAKPFQRYRIEVAGGVRCVQTRFVLSEEDRCLIFNQTSMNLPF
ncbi:hypothetical protein EDD18DRAFT_610118 [Armillaria luteobubalina]|uniref:Secreted protein n=1 Tax=Armillaria luteobubalina TaxID=153913 RepID=A0AA39QJQ1_9AGAR|nr:hypothetical protein EDD18DRAFT_610118 [Armillaria luteobubalina]